MPFVYPISSQTKSGDIRLSHSQSRNGFLCGGSSAGPQPRKKVMDHRVRRGGGGKKKKCLREKREEKKKRFGHKQLQLGFSVAGSKLNTGYYKQLRGAMLVPQFLPSLDELFVFDWISGGCIYVRNHSSI